MLQFSIGDTPVDKKLCQTVSIATRGQNYPAPKAAPTKSGRTTVLSFRTGKPAYKPKSFTAFHWSPEIKTIGAKKEGKPEWDEPPEKCVRLLIPAEREKVLALLHFIRCLKE